MANLDAERVRREAAELQRLAAEARVTAYEAVAALESTPSHDAGSRLAEERALDARARAAAIAELANQQHPRPWPDGQLDGVRLDPAAQTEIEQELAALRSGINGSTESAMSCQDGNVGAER